MNRRTFLQAIPAVPAALATLTIPAGEWVGMDGAGADLAFALRTGQRVTIVTDLGRGGTILDYMPAGRINPPAYLVRRDFNGAREWYPESVLS